MSKDKQWFFERGIEARKRPRIDASPKYIPNYIALITFFD